MRIKTIAVDLYNDLNDVVSVVVAGDEYVSNVELEE
jgi:hypothetical protein